MFLLIKVFLFLKTYLLIDIEMEKQFREIFIAGCQNDKF